MNYYSLGIISRTYGIRGHFKFRPFIENKRRLLTLKKVYIGPNVKSVVEYEVFEVRLSRDGIIIKLQNVNTREQAKTLKDMYLFISENDVVKPPDNHYYIHDIIGCTVAFGRKKLGKVIDVHRKIEGFAQDIWVVDGKPEIWIPVIPQYIKKVDIKKKKIIVQDVEGFL